ncbi:MAG: histidinol phosphate phosphatase [Alphaproteobacteria bacterium]|nr:histidinol phosphate phosphatase [Alphaproteobacteria bacterium]
MGFTCPDEFVVLAHALADAAGPIALKYFRSANLSFEQKDDASPVTRADREIEIELRHILAIQRPQDGIFGEEQGHSNPDAEYQWILDPIDGTKPFTAGSTNFGTLIALSHREQGIILGLCNQPVTKDRWTGVRNGETLFNGKPVKTRGTATIEKAIFACNNPLSPPRDKSALVKAVHDRAVMTTYGGVCLNYALLASGFVDIVIDSRQQIYDVAPFIPMIENAGGKITQLNGAPIGFAMSNCVLAASTPELHAEILALHRAVSS